jgi:hypothetical protein
VNYLFSLTNLTQKMFYFDKPHVCVFGCVCIGKYSLGHYASLFFWVFFAIAQVYVASVGVVGLVTNCEEF